MIMTVPTDPTIEPIRLSKILHSSLVPLDLISPNEGVPAFLDRVIVTLFEPQGFDPNPGGQINVELSVTPELVCSVSGLEGFSLVLGGASSSLVTYSLKMIPGQTESRLGGSVRLRFPREWLRPVVQVNGK